MTEAEFETEVQALRKNMEEAQAKYHRFAGALQFAEFMKDKVTFSQSESEQAKEE